MQKCVRVQLSVACLAKMTYKIVSDCLDGGYKLGNFLLLTQKQKLLLLLFALGRLACSAT